MVIQTHSGETQLKETNDTKTRGTLFKILEEENNESHVQDCNFFFLSRGHSLNFSWLSKWIEHDWTLNNFNWITLTWLDLTWLDLTGLDRTWQDLTCLDSPYPSCRLCLPALVESSDNGWEENCWGRIVNSGQLGRGPGSYGQTWWQTHYGWYQAKHPWYRGILAAFR